MLPPNPPPNCRDLKEHGRGGIGVVYKANHSKYRQVAVKWLKNDDDARHELKMMKLTQAANPAGLNHVCPLLDEWISGDDLYIIMPIFTYVLELARPDEMNPFALISIAAGSSKGLVEFYRALLINTDVKPSNLAVGADGRVVHIDHGGVHHTSERMRQWTPGFAPPEVEAGQSKSTSPIYSWGRSMEYFVSGRNDLAPACRLEALPWIGKPFSDLVYDCCNPNPYVRPDAQTLSRRMSDIKHWSENNPCPKCKSFRMPEGKCWKNCK
jgi:serine/threonine protein kinase